SGARRKKVSTSSSPATRARTGPRRSTRPILRSPSSTGTTATCRTCSTATTTCTAVRSPLAHATASVVEETLGRRSLRARTPEQAEEREVHVGGFRADEHLVERLGLGVVSGVERVDLRLELRVQRFDLRAHPGRGLLGPGDVRGLLARAAGLADGGADAARRARGQSLA